MNSRLQNTLIVIENGQLNTYVLDDKAKWEVGRLSKDNYPDINFHSPTVSRKHGRFQHMDGIWFYLDYNSKNGTVHKNQKIKAGAGGRIKPILLSDQDVLIFGGGENAVINNKTVWAMYSSKCYDNSWNIIDIKGKERLKIIDGMSTRHYEKPEKGTVLDLENGIVIFMEEIAFVTGDVLLQ